jgi:hypothetical protein
MAGGGSITDRDRGFGALLRAVKGASGTVQVGVADTPREDDRGLTNADVAAFHEFGDRPFIRPWVDENQPGIRSSLRYWVTQTLAGKKPWRNSLEKFGEYAVKGIRKKIDQGVPPPLAKSTEKRKGHALALVDTKQMYDAVTYEIDEAVK